MSNPFLSIEHIVDASFGFLPPLVAAKRKPRAYKLAEVLPAGEVLKAMDKTEWRLGPSVGQGGFGQLYLGESRARNPYLCAFSRSA